MKKLTIRCSSLYKIMSNPKGKTNLQKYEDTFTALNDERVKYEAIKNKETLTAAKKLNKISDLTKELLELKPLRNIVTLSTTAKTYIKELAKQEFYGYESTLSNKYMTKGHENEDLAIEVLSAKLGAKFTKNEERKNNGYLTGECDINYKKEKTIRDIKNAWSLETFPILTEDVDQKSKEAGYTWQQKGYLILWGYKKAYIDYCFTDTPKHLLSEHDNFMIHETDKDIDPGKYITTSTAIELEDGDTAEVKRKHKAAEVYYNEILTELAAK